MSGRLVRTVCTVALAAGAVLTPPIAPALADPADRQAGELLDELRTLYHRAESATDAYNGTHEALRREQKRVDALGRELAATRTELARSRRDAGRIARAEYRHGTGLSPALRVLLSPDPARALDDSHELQRAADARAATIDRLTGGEQRLRTLEAKARKALDRRESLADRQRKLRDTIRSRLAQVERLLMSLTRDQLEALRTLETEEAKNADRAVPGADDTADDARKASAAGRKAVAYALQQLGKPYRWGAQGPGAFDCSGLTSRAWAHAGKPIPRTSQGQWRKLPRVALDDLRPGDLVVYRRDASHVALYLGDGKVVHAPRPGRTVEIAPLTMMQVLGAVRPDGDEAPVSAKEKPAEQPADTAPDGDHEAESTQKQSSEEKAGREKQSEPAAPANPRTTAAV